MGSLALAGTDAHRGLAVAPHLVVEKMDGESCVANRAEAKALFIYGRDAAVRRATFTGGTGTHRGLAEKESWN